MINNNKSVAEEIVKQLKKKEIVSSDENGIENQIANGSIKESDWRLIFEGQIKKTKK